jgi:aspartate/methionine/tyrosine aminotransferase
VPQLADLLPRYVNMVNPVRPITRENSVPGPGIGALLANLIWTLCDEGDGVLLSAVRPYSPSLAWTWRLMYAQPYYHDYDRDIMYPGKAVPVLAHVPADIDSQSSAVLLILRERIRTSAARDGVPIRCLILCNPHNPIPQCYPLETIQGYIDIAREVWSKSCVI